MHRDVVSYGRDRVVRRNGRIFGLDRSAVIHIVDRGYLSCGKRRFVETDRSFVVDENGNIDFFFFYTVRNDSFGIQISVMCIISERYLQSAYSNIIFSVKLLYGIICRYIVVCVQSSAENRLGYVYLFVFNGEVFACGITADGRLNSRPRSAQSQQLVYHARAVCHRRIKEIVCVGRKRRNVVRKRTVDFTSA